MFHGRQEALERRLVKKGCIVDARRQSSGNTVMIRALMSFDKSKRLVLAIPHRSAEKAVENNWKQGGTAGVTAQSICWLYCWAKTGLGSEQAARASKEAFNQIFDHSYEWFDSRIDHEWARSARYISRDIEPELHEILRG